MPPPIPSSTPTKASPAAAPLALSASGGQHQIVARYYRRMKPWRVYRLVVELRSLAKKGTGGIAPTGDAVRVRPQVPGCFITPTELDVSPKGSANRATFYVTPLANGRLRDARIGVYHQGRMLQEVPLAMKAVTQCLTRWLLFLTVAAPLFLWWGTAYLDLSAPKTPGGKNRAPVPERKATASDEAPPNAEPADAPADAEPKPVRRKPGPLEKALIQNVPEYQGYTRQAARHVQQGYDALREKQQKEHLGFWVFASFLGLTVLSLATHRQSRGKRKGKPLALPAPATTPDFGGSDALSFNIPIQPMR